MQGTVKEGRRQGRLRKRWEDNIREWTGLEFAKSQRAVENRKKMEETGCEIICGAPTTLAVKGLMMMIGQSVLENNYFNRTQCHEDAENNRTPALQTTMSVVVNKTGKAEFSELDLFIADLFPERCWLGLGSHGRRGKLRLTLHCHHQSDCAFR